MQEALDALAANIDESPENWVLESESQRGFIYVTNRHKIYNEKIDMTVEFYYDTGDIYIDGIRVEYEAKALKASIRNLWKASEEKRGEEILKKMSALGGEILKKMGKSSKVYLTPSQLERDTYYRIVETPILSNFKVGNIAYRDAAIGSSGRISAIGHKHFIRASKEQEGYRFGEIKSNTDELQKEMREIESRMDYVDSLL